VRTWAKVTRYLFLGFVYLNILLPVLFILVYSLNEARFFVLPVQGWSLKWYVQALTGGRFLEGFAVSLEVAIAATIVSAVTGTLASISLVRGGIPGAYATADSSPVPDTRFPFPSPIGSVRQSAFGRSGFISPPRRTRSRRAGRAASPA
jgi:ABC-type spermidine/putrescine transport system permease subunit II